jgi:predicted HicB family RNase H-like nuclease
MRYTKQMTIRVDGKTKAAARAQAKQAGQPVSVYLRNLINHRGPEFAASIARVIGASAHTTKKAG